MISEFFTMGGYGAYVWSSFALTVILLLLEVMAIRRKHQKVVQRIFRIQQLRASQSSGEQR